MPNKRRSRIQCEPMPEVLSLHHVQGVYSWPLGNAMTAKARGTGWTDCLLVFVDTIRLGGAVASRRVRYDGRLYVTHGARRVYLDGSLTAAALEFVTHVYGIDAESDKMHNLTLKGY
jgi:hypothetical protein